MPLYEVFAALPPSMPKDQLAKRMTDLGRVVFGVNGVLMDIRSYGINTLGYEVAGTSGKHREAFMFGADVAVGEEGLKEVEKTLRFDKEMLRWRILKKTLKPHFDARAVKMRELVESGRLDEELRKLKGSQ